MTHPLTEKQYENFYKLVKEVRKRAIQTKTRHFAIDTRELAHTCGVSEIEAEAFCDALRLLGAGVSIPDAANEGDMPA